MSAIVRDAVREGAMGVSSSHDLGHRAVDGELAPSVGSAQSEILALTRQAQADGLPIKAQIHPRPTGVLMGLALSLHPFRFHPSYLAIQHLPLAERVAAMREPEWRKRILSEQPVHTNPVSLGLVSKYDDAFALGDPPNHEPSPDPLLAARTKALGMRTDELAYQVLLEDEGRSMILNPMSNFAQRNLAACREMLVDDHSLIGLGDGGAHYGMICDSSFPTTMLTLWKRDRQTGRVPLEWAVRRLTRDNALAVQLHDRGLVAEGMKADLNVIDCARPRLHPPRLVSDLPAGGRRLMQGADGYTATVVSGEVTYRNGLPTGAQPGRLQPARQSNA